MIKFLYFFFIIFLFSCSNSLNEEVDVKNFSLRESKGQNIKIKIDSSINYITSTLHYYEKENARFIFFFNHSQNEILRFNLNSLDIDKRIKIKQEGPKSIGKVTGFSISSLDSIYITLNSPKIALINEYGKLVNQFNFPEYSKDKPFLVIESSTSGIYAPLVVKHNKIYLCQVVFGNFNKISTKELSNFSVCVSIDTLKRKAEFYNFGPPEHYKKSFRDPLYCRSYDGGNFLYSWKYDHNIYVTKDHSKIKTYEAKSKNIENVFPEQKRNLNMQQLKKYFIETPEYGPLIYDEYNEVYYRFVYLGKKLKKGDYVWKVQKDNYSIIIMDKKFQKIGETKFKIGKYHFGNFFITKEGIYISCNNINNPEFDENYLKFQLFNLVEDEN